jgi:DNA-binding NtrC family response regulator
MSYSISVPSSPAAAAVVAVSGPIPRAIFDALRTRGVSSHGKGAIARVIATRTARAPAVAAGLPWIWLAPRGASYEAAAQAVLAGAYDVIDAGSDDVIDRLARRIAELATTEPEHESPHNFVAHSGAARAVIAAVSRAARTAMPVLLTGETGTGKDLVAKLLHAWSPRAKARFVPINCAAIPNELMEAELFGYVRGAFSGAVHDYAGAFAAAAGGTVFLDEVDDTPPTLQAKLLRVLEDRVVARLGENEPREVDFRIVAATNRDLPAMVRRGAFGGDLFQRLAIVQLRMPPLRDRADDLPHLVMHFIARFAEDEPSSPHVTAIHPLALRALAAYPWPGNVRELRNVVYQALVGKRAGDELLLADLPAHVVRGEPPSDVGDGGADRDGGRADRVIDLAALGRAIDAGRFQLRATRDQLELEALRLALARAGGSPTAAARLLGEVGRGRARDPGGTVRAMMRRHKLS